MFKISMALLSILVFMTSADAQQNLSAARSELTPTGKLRVGINFGNALLTRKDANGTPGGIAVDLAHELARRLNVAVEIVPYPGAGEMADGAKAGAWDAAFLAADPGRAQDIIFTDPYVEIESTYMVPASSPLRTPGDVDREGVRIVVTERSAYDLALTRIVKRAELVRVPGVDGSVDYFFKEKLDALAGLKPLLVEAAGRQPGFRILDGRFAVVEQAVGTPKGREAAAKFLSDFVRDIKASGLVARTIEKNGIRGITVPGS